MNNLNIFKSMMNIRNNDIYFIVILIIISVLFHFPFVLDGLGEADSARIAVSVIDRLEHGDNGAFVNLYFIDTVPLYCYYLSRLMVLFNNNYNLLPLIMNYTNSIVATLFIIPAYMFVRRLYGSRMVAFYSILVFLFTPSFFQASIYGFPHLIALFFFIISIYFYLNWIDNLKSSNYLHLTLSSIFLVIAFLFKSDVVLGCGVFPGLLVLRRLKEKRIVVASLFFLFFSLMIFFLLRKLILGSIEGTTTSVSGFYNWYEIFFIKSDFFKYFINHQIRPIVLGFGIVTSVLGLVIFTIYIVRKRFINLILLISWSIVPIIFWIFIHGNSARHNLIALLPIIILIIDFLYEKFSKFIVFLALLIIAGNYVAISVSSSTSFPSGNLLKSAVLLQEKANKYHEIGRKISAIDKPKIAVLGYYQNPWIIFEIIKNSDDYSAKRLAGRENFVININQVNSSKTYKIFYCPSDGFTKNRIDTILSNYSLKEYLIITVIGYSNWINEKGYLAMDL